MQCLYVFSSLICPSTTSRSCLIAPTLDCRSILTMIDDTSSAREVVLFGNKVFPITPSRAVWLKVVSLSRSLRLFIHEAKKETSLPGFRCSSTRKYIFQSGSRITACQSAFLFSSRLDDSRTETSLGLHRATHLMLVGRSSLLILK